MGWRLIDTDIGDPYFVTAADEAIAEAKKQDRTPNTLHFYRRKPPAVSIGRSRKIHEDINVEECDRKNIKIVRRTTGGGTIYTDEGCLIYSLVFNKKDISVVSSEKVFEQVCNSLVNTLKQFNIYPVYKPPNDVLLNGKKISGSAQIKKDEIILIHGTILLESNLENMRAVLKQPKTSVSSIKNENDSVPPIHEVKNALKKEFETYFDITMEKSTFSKFENDLIEKLLKDRYLKDSWNFMR